MSKKHYINNADFLAALIDYKERCKKAKKDKKEDPPIPNYVGECFLKIAEHLSRKPNFVSYSFRDEMIADGIENCIQYFRNFDETKSKNPFAYFTQIIYFAFLRKPKILIPHNQCRSRCIEFMTLLVHSSLKLVFFITTHWQGNYSIIFLSCVLAQRADIVGSLRGGCND